VAVLTATLLMQTGWLRPRLDRRAVRVIGGHEDGRSSVHLLYVALEVLKLLLLAASGAVLSAQVG
jgi:hypothetical protein